MRRLLVFVLGLAVVVVLVMGVFGPTTVQADSPNAAIVLKDLDHPLGCHFFVSDIGNLDTTDEVHTTATSSGNVTLTCHFNIPEGFEPAKVVKSSGFGCGIFLPGGSMSTNNTTFVATPGGRATLKCQINGSN